MGPSSASTQVSEFQKLPFVLFETLQSERSADPCTPKQITLRDQAMHGFTNPTALACKRLGQRRFLQSQEDGDQSTTSSFYGSRSLRSQRRRSQCSVGSESRSSVAEREAMDQIGYTTCVKVSKRSKTISFNDYIMKEAHRHKRACVDELVHLAKKLEVQDDVDFFEEDQVILKTRLCKNTVIEELNSYVKGILKEFQRCESDTDPSPSNETFPSEENQATPQVNDTRKIANKEYNFYFSQITMVQTYLKSISDLFSNLILSLQEPGSLNGKTETMDQQTGFFRQESGQDPTHKLLKTVLGRERWFYPVIEDQSVYDTTECKNAFLPKGSSHVWDLAQESQLCESDTDSSHSNEEAYDQARPTAKVPSTIKRISIKKHSFDLPSTFKSNYFSPLTILPTNLQSTLDLFSQSTLSQQYLEALKGKADLGNQMPEFIEHNFKQGYTQEESCKTILAKGSPNQVNEKRQKQTLKKARLEQTQKQKFKLIEHQFTEKQEKNNQKQTEMSMELEQKQMEEIKQHNQNMASNTIQAWWRCLQVEQKQRQLIRNQDQNLQEDDQKEKRKKAARTIQAWWQVWQIKGKKLLEIKAQEKHEVQEALILIKKDEKTQNQASGSQNDENKESVTSSKMQEINGTTSGFFVQLENQLAKNCEHLVQRERKTAKMELGVIDMWFISKQD